MDEIMILHILSEQYLGNMELKVVDWYLLIFDEKLIHSIKQVYILFCKTCKIEIAFLFIILCISLDND